MQKEIDFIVDQISNLEIDEKINALNLIREKLHKISPFKAEPVDFVKWVKNEIVFANDYNPNSVAPLEMELLKTSIAADGYTQPIVGNQEDDKIIVVDGFHRHRVGKEFLDIKERVLGYLPVVQIRSEQVDKDHRMASTIRHNRARGKHKVEAMSDIVVELKRRNWSDERICRELGMEQDEVLRLCQITGLQELFENNNFSLAWEPEGHISVEDFEEISGNAEDYVEESIKVITHNTNDENRIFHTFDQWECYKSGFYNTSAPKGLTADDCKSIYRDFLSNLEDFEKGLLGVINDWPKSCEHYLTNLAMNRIAWLGQAALCYSKSIPSTFRGGYNLLTLDQQKAADNLALKYLNIWLKRNGMNEVTMDEACTTRQSDIY